MDNKVQVLLVVEGAKTELDFFKQISKEYSLNIEISCFKTNIYTLYQKMAKENFQIDLKAALIESSKSEEEIEKLKKKFAYTYLIFDFDPQHTEIPEKNKDSYELINSNIKKLKEMTDYFTNETDPTIGKLYVNYPMFESYKCCNAFFDECYANEYYSIFNVKKFKKYAGQRKISNVRADRLTRSNFDALCKMNVFKLSKIINGEWKSIKYSDYSNISSSNILNAQEEIIKNSKKIAVLNTSLLFLTDYYGNKNGFYDRIVGLQNDT